MLVVTEVALALILLVGSALLIRTAVALGGVDPGFDPRNVLTMRMSFTGPRFLKSEGVEQVIRDGVERLRNVPGVVAASATCCVPLEGGYGLPFTIVGRAGAGAGRSVSRRRPVDDDVAGLLRRLQDSRQARPRLQRTRHQRRAGRRRHQRGDGEAVLAGQAIRSTIGS